MLPIFVVDRPVSLKILEGLDNCSGKFGILAHAFTSDNFKEKFNDFKLAKWKIGDSGIYQGKDIPYNQLFGEYIKMGVTHGIIKDFYRDPERTLKSAKDAMNEFTSGGYSKKFKLVGVAQGIDPNEYLDSYTKQRDLGYEMVAIGGLLDKIEKHVRMVKVKREEILKEILLKIRNEYPNDDIFPLGVFNRSRLGMFKDIGVWGSDYKGWIFRYNISESHLKNNRFEQTRKYIETQILPSVNNQRLLILSCSQSKRYDKGKAIELYDGPAFRIVRNYLKTKNGIDVKIISAKYGLIGQNEVIDTYDLKMTDEKADEYRKKYSREFRTLEKSFGDIFVFGGKNYMKVTKNRNFKFSQGRIGEKLSQLKTWLESDLPKKPL